MVKNLDKFAAAKVPCFLIHLMVIINQNLLCWSHSDLHILCYSKYITRMSHSSNSETEAMSRKVGWKQFRLLRLWPERYLSDSIQVTHFYIIRDQNGSRWFSPPPPPPPPPCSIENRRRNIDISFIILKGILWRFRFNSNFSK